MAFGNVRKDLEIQGFIASPSKGWKRQWNPTPVLLPGKPHGQRSLVGYSPWGRKGLDSTERLSSHLKLIQC